MQIQIGQWPLHVKYLKNGDLVADFPEDMDPFHYQAKLEFDQKDDEDASYSVYALCNNIPCHVCTLSEKCQNGKNRQEVFLNLVKEEFPEILV